MHELDSQHTHFILVDDGPELTHKVGEVIEFRRMLEVALIDKKEYVNAHVFVVGGGPQALFAISNALYESINVTVFHVIFKKKIKILIIF